ncbi:hypothetical protein BJ322DRAFT_50016 [Thelephora terrestris]|uniref:Uncharacterized protein n=1 Tax=Thelephora terrestris TaxID=56493 RepID=A0A9P6LC87_9AGAM|nr:hypothetical protein BJ322DRAFT_50016 [Thelephora terrestris]
MTGELRLSGPPMGSYVLFGPSPTPLCLLCCPRGHVRPYAPLLLILIPYIIYLIVISFVSRASIRPDKCVRNDGVSRTLGTFLRVVILVGSDLQPLKMKSHLSRPGRIVVLTGVPLSTGASSGGNRGFAPPTLSPHAVGQVGHSDRGVIVRAAGRVDSRVESVDGLT